MRVRAGEEGETEGGARRIGEEGGKRGVDTKGVVEGVHFALDVVAAVLQELLELLGLGLHGSLHLRVRCVLLIGEGGEGGKGDEIEGEGRGGEVGEAG